MPVSGSDKVGVSVLGCHFSERAEHVPIKKRRFLFRSPSPPPRTTSPQVGEGERLVKRKQAADQEFHLDSLAKCHLAGSDAAASADLGQIVGRELINKGKNSINDSLCESEDFSGISVLAEAACDNSLVGYAEKVSAIGKSIQCEGALQVRMKNESKAELLIKGTGLGVPTAAIGDSPALMTDNSFPKDLPLEKMEGTSSPQISLAGSQSLLSDRDDGKVTIQESSARDDRLHWDLNTVMDAWEHPFDCHHVYLPMDKSEKSLGHEFQKECGSNGKDIGEGLLQDELKQLVCETEIGYVEEHKLDPCIDVNRVASFQEKVHSSGIVHATDIMMDPIDQTKSLKNQERISSNTGSVTSVSTKQSLEHFASPGKCVNFGTGNSETLSSHQVTGVDLSVDSLFPPDIAYVTSPCLPDENCVNASTETGCVKTTCDSHTETQFGGFISCSCQAENQDATFHIIPSSNKTSCEIGNLQNEDGGDVKGICGLYEDEIKPVRNEPSDDVKGNASCRPDEVSSSHPYHTDVKNLPRSFVGCSSAVTEDSSIPHAAETDTQEQGHAREPPSGLSSHGTCRNNPEDVHSSKVALEATLDDARNSDVSGDDLCPLTETAQESELKLDYDSQYEDGELRESSGHLWDEYDGDDAETECVDYGSDNRDTNNMGSASTEDGFPSCLGGSPGTKATNAGSGRDASVKTTLSYSNMWNSVEVESSCRGSDSQPDQAIADDGNSSGQDNKEPGQSADLKTKTSGWDQLPEHRSSDMGNCVRDGSVKKNCKDGVSAEELETGVGGSSVYGKESLSRAGGPPSSSSFRRRNRVGLHGSSDIDDTNPRYEREVGMAKSFGRGRYSVQIHARSRGGDPWLDFSEGDRGLRRHHSPTHGLASFRCTGPEDIKIGYAVHKSLRSGSPSDRQNSFDMRTGTRPAGDTSPGRCVSAGRGSSLRYGLWMDGGGPAGRYSGAMNGDSVGSSLYYSHPLARRRRSFSPLQRRGNTRSRRCSSKSPSRSRTRSPNALQSPRGRSGTNLSFRHRSRSPNFHSRLKSPQLRPDFAADHVIGFMSVERSNGSPLPNSRWIGYKQRSLHPDKRSPGRIGLRGNRWDALDSLEKLKPYESYRSVRPGRCSEVNGVGRVGHRDEVADDDRRKHGHRYGLVHPARRYDDDKTVKRFHHDIEGGFTQEYDSRDKDGTEFHGRENPRSYSRGIDRRIGGVPRRYREERGMFLHRRDGKYIPNSRSFGTREGDEELVSRRRRHL